MVQNFLSSLDTDITKNDLVEKILQMFSDIPTTTQAIKKLKEMRQGENESILVYNQRYKTLVERVEGRPIELITSPVAMEMYLGTIIPPLQKSIKNSIFWGSKHAPNTVGEAMSKAQQLYVKHLYAAGDEQEEGENKTTEEVVINEISRKFENKYKTRGDDFHDSSSSRQNNNGQDQKRWQSYDTRKSFGNSQKYHQQQVTSDMDQRDFQARPNSMTNRQESSVDQASSYQPNAVRQINVTTKNDDSTRQGNRSDHNQSSILRSGYTQIMVNLMLLSDLEFTHWMEKLVEARKHR